MQTYPPVGLESNPGNVVTPYKGKAIPVKGFFAFAEISWNSKLKSSVGYSYEKKLTIQIFSRQML
ncbi:MAG: hypothetical protein ABI462_14195 [Ignavibacteria bacterium]